MNETIQITQLLAQKQELFLQFAHCTEAMLTCPREQLEEQLARREELMGEIDALDREVDRLARQSGQEEQILGAVRGSADWDSLPPQLRPVYEGAAAVRTVVSRLAETEAQAGVRMVLEQERILEQIKASSRSGAAQAARFLSSDDHPQPASILKA